MRKKTRRSFIAAGVVCAVVFSMAVFCAQDVHADTSGTFRGISYTITDDGELQLGAAGQTQTMTDRESYFSNIGDYDRVRFMGRVNATGSIRRMFENTKSVENIAYLNTQDVTDMSELFKGAKMTNLDLSSFNTAKVTDMSSMFSGCRYLASVDLSSFNTAKVTDMSAMFSGCRGLASVSMSSFDTGKTTAMNQMFANCTSLTGLDLSGFDTGDVTDMSEMFSYCESLTSLRLGDPDTRKVTNMSNMFNGCKNLTALDVSGLDTENVTDFFAMFYNCSALTSLDLKDFDTSKAQRMSSMFCLCSSLTRLDVSKFDTSGVTSMSGMFLRCSALKELDLANFKTSKVTSMEGMFRDCASLTSLDLSCFDTGQTANMVQMFQNCTSLTTLDLSSFDTSSAPTMLNMFDGASKLSTLCLGEDFAFNLSHDPVLVSPSDSGDYTGKWINAAKDTYTSQELMEGYDGSTMSGKYIWELAIRVDLADSIGEAKAIQKGDYSDRSFDRLQQCIQAAETALDPFDAKAEDLQKAHDDLEGAVDSLRKAYRGITVNITDDGELQLGDPDCAETMTYSDTTFYLPESYGHYDRIAIVGPIKANGSIGYMFHNVEAITGIENLDTENATNMNHMFTGCKQLASLDVSGFDTSNVTDMSNMFGEIGYTGGCSSLMSLDVSGFDTSRVTNMYGMFANCSSLTELDVSGFDTDNVTNMGEMFYNCSGLTDLDLDGLDTSNAGDMEEMFCNCSGLTNLDVSGFDTGSAKNFTRMFSGCSGLTSLDVSGFDTSNVSDMDQMFSDCSSLTSLDVSGFDTGSATSLLGMFLRCSGIEELDLTSFDTSNVTDMGYMFKGCTSLSSVDLSSFDTSKTTSMIQMFENCTSLTALDLSNFDTGKTWNMRDTFAGASNLSTLYLGEDFAFRSGQDFDPALVSPPDGVDYTSRWINAAKETFTAGELMNGYDGSTMSGKYIWELSLRVELADAISDAKEIKKGRYTDESFNDLQQSIQAAETALDPFDAPAEDLQKAYDDLKDAVSSLKEKAPEGTLIAKMTAKGGKSLQISWTGIQNVDGYDIFFAKCNEKKIVKCKKVKTIKGSGTLKWTRSKLRAKTAYKAYVKAYVMKNGKKTYVRTSPMVHAFTSGGTGKYTNAKSVTVSKTAVRLKKGKTYRIRASVKKLSANKVLMSKTHAPKLRYLSSNKKVATVSSTGTIKAKGKGSCVIYVYSVNGVWKTVKVTVR